MFCKKDYINNLISVMNGNYLSLADKSPVYWHSECASRILNAIIAEENHVQFSVDILERLCLIYANKGK